MCGGASAGQESVANSQMALSKQMQSDFNTYFGENQSILAGLTSSLSPIVAAGPDQYGFNPAESAALRTGATENISAAGQEASNATRSAMAAQGGGNIYLPTGAQDEVNAELAQSTAQKQAEAQNQITSEGYDVGRQQFNQAVGEEAGAAGALENPVTGAGEATGGTLQAAGNTESQIQQANAAGSPLGVIGALAGTALKGAMAGL